MRKINKLALGLVLLLGLLFIGSVKLYAYDSNNENLLIPDGYYSGLSLDNTDEAFRRELSAIISKDVKSYPYSGSGTDVHEILTKSDEAPIGGMVECIYSGNYMQYAQRGEIHWDKEHVWAKSHGFPANPYENEAVFSDAHNLRPARAEINQSRSNKDYGIVSNPTRVDYGNKQDDTTFEPRDDSKGDIARIMFYMATRYGFDQFNLTLTNDKRTESSVLNGRFGNLDTLVKWHYEDPVSISEIYRNNVVYGFQNNRNPYIDHPEYVSLAYPNPYDDMVINEARINTVINAIDYLPAKATINDREAIINTKNEFNKLNTTEKTKVSNYLKLDKLITELEVIDYNASKKEAEKPITPVEGISYKYEFTKKVFTASNQTQVLNELPWTLSFTGGALSSFDKSKGIKLGTNSKPMNTIKLTTPAIGSVNKVIVTTSGNSKVNASLSVSVGNTTSAPQKVNYDSTAHIFDFNNVSGDISIDYNNTGSTGLYLKSIEIHYQKESADTSFIDEFIKVEAKSSLKIKYTDAIEVLDTDLRVGGLIPLAAFNSSAKYGVAVLDSDTVLSAGLVGDTTAEQEYGKKAIPATPVRVNKDGIEDNNGDYYQFAWVITNMEGHYDYLFNTALYMEYNGKLYLSIPKMVGVCTTANDYIELNTFSGEILEVLKKIAGGK